MAGTIKGIVVEIGGDTSGLQKALRSVNTATSSLTKELRGINSLLKLDPSNTELLAQKQTVLAKNIEETSNKLDVLRKTQEEADNAMANGTEISEENYRNLQREIINTENKLKQLQLEASNWTKAGAKLEEFGTKVGNIASKIDTLGSTLTTSLTLPVLAIGTAAVTTGNDFEAQMSRVQAIAGATKDELKQLTDQAIDLGASTSFSASEVASGMENLASAGFTTQEIMEAMPGLLNLAASSGADLATSSEIAASAIRGFGLEASTSAHVADIFAEASARTNAQVEDMGEAMKYIAPVANTMGLKIEEVAAAIGIMSDAGIKGSQAGTSLRGALTRLTKPTDKMLGVMEDLGISFYDNEGKMKSLTEMIAMLQDATKGLTDEQQQNALTILFGTESLSGMMSLINRGSGELSDMTKSFEDCDGAAQDMADTMLDNTKGAFESLSGSLESAGIAIQQALAPSIRDLSEWIQDLVDDFNDLSDEEKENIIKTALLVAAIGPAVKILGTLTSGVGKAVKGIGTLSQAIGVLKTGAQSANTTVNTLSKVIGAISSPIGLLVTTITTAATAAIYFATKETEAQKKAKEMAETIAETRQSYEEYNASIDKTTQSNINQMDYTQRLSDELKTLVDENGKVKDGYETRVDFILNELNNALGTEYDLNGNIIESYKELQGEIDDLIKKKKAELIVTAEQEKQAEARDKEKQAVEDLKNTVDQLGMSYEEAKDIMNNTYSAQQKLAKGNANLTEREREVLNNYTNDQRGTIRELVEAYENSSATLNQSLETQKQYQNDYALFLQGKYDEIGQTVTTTTQNYSNASLTELKNNIDAQKIELDRNKEIYMQFGSEVALQQQQQAQQNLMNLAAEMAERTQTVHDLSTDEIAAWKTMADSSFAAYSYGISKVGPEMQTKIQEATGVVAANTPEFAEQAGKMGQQVAEQFDKNTTAKESALSDLQGFYEGLNDEEKKQLLQETVGDRADEVAKQFENGDYETSGKNVLQGLYNGLSNGTLGQNLINKAAGIAKSIASQFNIQWDEHSPSKLMTKMAKNFLIPISTVFSKQQRGLTNKAKDLAKSIAEGFENSFNESNSFKMPNMKAITNEMKNQTKMIFTTPQITFNVQQLDEKNLESCFNYINKKFGSKY